MTSKIDVSKPVYLVGFDDDHQAEITEVRGNSILGYVYSNRMRCAAMWDEFGQPIGDTMLYGSIENVRETCRKIDPSKPVCSTESFPAFIRNVDRSGVIHGEIVVNGHPSSMSWDACGQRGADPTWNIMNVPDGYAMIDLGRPVETMEGDAVTGLREAYHERWGATLVGDIQDGDDPFSITWSRYGKVVTEQGYHWDIRNVAGAAPFKPLIDLTKPAETVKGLPVHVLRYTNPHRISGYVVTGKNREKRLDWDRYGNVSPDFEEEIERDGLCPVEDWAIRNVVDLIEEQRRIEAEHVSEFRDIVRNYVERRLYRDYDASFHGQFVAGREVGFVQLARQGGAWEVWELCEDYAPIDILPDFLPADELGCFWNWLRDRQDRAEERGRQRGFQDGYSSFQRKLQDLAGFNPNKFQPRSDDDY